MHRLAVFPVAARPQITGGGVRLGGTSWVTEGSLAENLRCLSGEVSDMEIVLFDLPHASNIPAAAEVEELARLCVEREMSCTVHFPSELDARGSRRESLRSADGCLKIIELFSPLRPFAWILHVTRGGEAVEGAGWLENARDGLKKLAEAIPEGKRLCVENTDYDLACLQSAIEASGVSVCLDIGHLISLKTAVMEQVERYFSKTRVVHLHGTKPDGSDHTDLSHFDVSLLRQIFARYGESGEERVITLEVFEQDFLRSVRVLKDIFGRGR